MNPRVPNHIRIWHALHMRMQGLSLFASRPATSMRPHQQPQHHSACARCGDGGKAACARSCRGLQGTATEEAKGQGPKHPRQRHRGGKPAPEHEDAPLRLRRRARLPQQQPQHDRRQAHRAGGCAGSHGRHARGRARGGRRGGDQRLASAAAHAQRGSQRRGRVAGVVRCHHLRARCDTFLRLFVVPMSGKRRRAHGRRPDGGAAGRAVRAPLPACSAAAGGAAMEPALSAAKSCQA
jgi:hypothetical protein